LRSLGIGVISYGVRALGSIVVERLSHASQSPTL